MSQVEGPTVGLLLNALGKQRAQWDADRLLARVLGCGLASLRAFPERTLSDDQQARWQALVARRAAGEPFAYITGEQEFWSLPLAVGPGVLVPRADSEVLVEAVLARLGPDCRGWIADVGTGSANLALAVASERAQLRVLAVEISDQALPWARRNVAKLGAGRVCLIQAGALDAVIDGSMQAVISNPPYIARGDPDLHVDAARHEPEQALIAADQGMAVLHQLIVAGCRVLCPDGWIFLEHGWKQGPAVLSALRACGYRHCQTLTDLASRPRVSLGQR